MVIILKGWSCGTPNISIVLLFTQFNVIFSQQDPSPPKTPGSGLKTFSFLLIRPMSPENCLLSSCYSRVSSVQWYCPHYDCNEKSTCTWNGLSKTIVFKSWCMTLILIFMILWPLWQNMMPMFTLLSPLKKFPNMRLFQIKTLSHYKQKIAMVGSVWKSFTDNFIFIKVKLKLQEFLTVFFNNSKK